MFCFVPRIAAVLLLVVAGTLVPAAAEDRPFKASGAGSFSINNGTLSARLEATHLGRANFNGEVDPNQLDNPQTLEIPAYFTAANGDRLYVDSIVDFDVDTGIAIGTLMFNGGTGRFQTASGSADVMFIFDLTPQRFLLVINGSIDY